MTHSTWVLVNCHRVWDRNVKAINKNDIVCRISTLTSLINCNEFNQYCLSYFKRQNRSTGLITYDTYALKYSSNIKIVQKPLKIHQNVKKMIKFLIQCNNKHYLTLVFNSVKNFSIFHSPSGFVKNLEIFYRIKH